MSRFAQDDTVGSVKEREQRESRAPDAMLGVEGGEHELKCPTSRLKSAREMGHSRFAGTRGEGSALLPCWLLGRFGRGLLGLGHGRFGFPEVRIGFDPVFRGVAHAGG